MRYNTEKSPKLPKAMTSENNPGNIVLTITFTDPELTDEERDEEAVELLKELEDNFDADIEAAHQVRDPNPPEGNKSIGAFLAGVLTTEISASGCRKVLHGFKHSLRKKIFILKAEVNGVKMEVSAASREDAEFALEKVEAFIDKHKV